MTSLLPIFRRSEPVDVLLYSRPDCPLCDDMKLELGRGSIRSKFVLREVNIETDPKLEELHGRSIPVLEIDGKLAFKGRLTATEFERKFKRLTRGRR